MYETYTAIIILNELYILADIVLISSVFSKNNNLELSSLHWRTSNLMKIECQSFIKKNPMIWPTFGSKCLFCLHLYRFWNHDPDGGERLLAIGHIFRSWICHSRTFLSQTMTSGVWWAWGRRRDVGTRRWKRMKQEEEQRRCESEGSWRTYGWWVVKDDETTLERTEAKYRGNVGDMKQERRAERQEGRGRRVWNKGRLSSEAVYLSVLRTVLGN